MIKTVSVQMNHRYRAHVHFGTFDPGRFVVSDAMIATGLQDKGFTNVSVVGEGQERWAFATWPQAGTSITLEDDIAEHLTEVKDITPDALAAFAGSRA